MVDSSGKWNWDLLQSLLPCHVLLRVVAIMPPNPACMEDTITWVGEPSGKFTIKSAYKVRLGTVSEREWEVLVQHVLREGNSVAVSLAKLADES
ncbi:hypothetical protein V6N11_058921 [Hibiscus sabdariffa]|uniref:Uncharacterized protein n=1 Tax=Hibiscus sabdariffa TaxID=183260 RepID=A0ABR2U5P8_9ROSI